jgi:hypothetical protein
MDNVVGLGTTCAEIQSVEMLTLIGGLCCVGFINPIGVVLLVSGNRDKLFLLGPP